MDLTDGLPAQFSAATRAWFAQSLGAPTPAQLATWEAVARGESTLTIAPTGSGKTLAGFLWAVDRLLHPPTAPGAVSQGGTRVVYLSPLKALAVDVERNLRSPLVGIRRQADLLGAATAPVAVGVRTGDTDADERRRMARRPPEILITTPESLYLLLTSAARAGLTGVETVIVDEIHALAGSKRGAHLALTLERLDALLTAPAQRLGLSATVRPAAAVAEFLGGARPVTVVQPATPKTIETAVVVPVADLTAPPPVPGDDRGATVWPHVEERIVDLIARHRSTLVFANSRRLAERLAGRLNEIAADRDQGVVARSHHGSVSREQRRAIEEELKAGRLPAVVATSSLELGIDMGAVDLVVQVEPPPSVAAGMQRIGRAGHQVGAVSRGVIFPKHRGELPAAAVVSRRMRDGLLEELRVPRHPLDVLAQQIIATTAMDDQQVDELFARVRCAAPYRDLPRSAFDAVIDMLVGRYPSDAFADLKPRLVLDRTTGLLTPRPGAQRLAVTNGGTIPDRGLFGVHLVSDTGGSRRVGELDEEMVYESRVGDVFALGSSSWRIEEITPDRVLVSPAPGVPGRLPFWHGDTPARPAELGRAIGGYVRELAAEPPEEAVAGAQAAGLDQWAAENLVGYLAEQRAATGVIPDDRTVLVERFRDELGDWRLVVHTPLGAAITAPWALAVGNRVAERFGVQPQTAHSDDGFVLRLPETAGDDWDPDDMVRLDPEEIESLVTAAVGGSALFAARFREAAGRALLLPRRDPQRRRPLWQQRQRAAQLLDVVRDFPDFPLVLEAVREVLTDDYDLAGLRALLADLAARRTRLVSVTTAQPSPFARSLLFGYVAAFLYEGDAPLAERRAQALTLDAGLLAELLGRADLRDLLDPAVIARTEAELQRLVAERHPRTVEEFADLLRIVGPLTATEAAERGVPQRWIDDLLAARRAFAVRLPGRECVAAVEDAARLRDAYGAALPVGLPDAFLTPVADPVGDIVSRHARTHGPFTTAEAAAELGLGPAVVAEALRRLEARGRIAVGGFRPGGRSSEWCDAEVLRLIRRRSLAALRRESEPVEPAALGRFLPAWQGVGQPEAGPGGLLRVIEQLEAVPLPASAWETLVLPARLPGYRPSWLDELTTAGEVLWCGRGALPAGDGWISLHLADSAPLTLPLIDDVPAGEWQRAILAALDGGAAPFFGQIADALGTTEVGEPATALWDLVWSGLVTNDTLAPVRELLALRGRPGGSPPAPVTATRGRRRLPRPPVRRDLTGRWSATPVRDGDPTRRAHSIVEVLLDRHGLLTRGAVAAEGYPGGFAAAYRVLSGFEEAGRCRRIHAVAGLGAAQFAVAGAVDRLRTTGAAPAVLLAAADPANPYGAALPWPAREGHRPGRGAGAVVVLVDGDLVLYMERGGRSLLSFTDDAAGLQPAVDSLALTVRSGSLGRVVLRRGDGQDLLAGGPLADALQAAGFVAGPQGLRLRT